VRFEFATASRILFAPGAAAQIPALAREFGRRALLVTGRSPGRVSISGFDCVPFPAPGEPTVDLVRRGIEHARSEGCDLVIGIGGGSAIDAGKAIAALVTNSGEPLDYLEVVGRGKPLEKPPLPFIAVPTTAGTGAEVTRNAVLGSPAHRVKASLRSPLMLPRVALIDPELTLDLPPAITASTGLDALTQLIEPYVSIRANAMVDMFCVEAMRRVARSLSKAAVNGRDLAARTDMCFASLLGGLALANAGLGVVHGFAAPIGGSYDAPHGAICAAVLPYGMDMNIRALRARAADHVALERYGEIARILTGRQSAKAEDAVAWVRSLCRRLGIPPLRAYGVETAHFPEVVSKAANASSMKGNPIPLTPEELTDVLARATAGEA
jgi:alcohol dehydrogenase class IV